MSLSDICVICGNPESICPCPGEITAARFKKATGHTPIDDALDRCNCKMQGAIGHWHCGWNVLHDKPNFYLRMDEVQKDRDQRGIPLQLGHTQ